MKCDFGYLPHILLKKKKNTGESMDKMWKKGLNLLEENTEELHKNIFVTLVNVNIKFKCYNKQNISKHIWL